MIGFDVRLFYHRNRTWKGGATPRWISRRHNYVTNTPPPCETHGENHKASGVAWKIATPIPMYGMKIHTLTLLRKINHVDYTYHTFKHYRGLQA